jgi:hypothetical protein
MPIQQRGEMPEPPRRLYGFVDALEPSGRADDGPRYRQSLLLDCVDAEAFDPQRAAIDANEALSLVRVLSTKRRLDQLYGAGDLKEGDWVEIELKREPGLPRAWSMPATQGYALQPATNLAGLTRLEPPGDAAGRMPSPSEKLALDLITAHLPTKQQELVDLSTVLSRYATLPQEVKIVSLDVGQASCVAFVHQGEAIGFFDVGAPLPFNAKSMPSKFSLPPFGSGFVFLSHWDFDHFDLARRFSALRDLDWFAPLQPVGPNTSKFQRQLANLKFVRGSFVGSTGVRATPGSSTDPNDRNGTGYSMRIDVGSSSVLLTGDTDYQFIDPKLLVDLTSITIPHHGGRGSDPPTPGRDQGRAVASYGAPNCYRHPNETHLTTHTARRWVVQRTATDPTTGPRRGNRLLHP